MPVQEIIQTVFRMGNKRITLTGGEPLIHEDVYKLVAHLEERGFEVNIETNGSVDIGAYRSPGIIITMDYKCPSSGMEDKMLLENLDRLRSSDIIKFVVGSKADLDTCLRMKAFTRAQVFISPVFGQIEPKEIVEYMLEHNMQDCRIQLQLHKFIWDPSQRGV